MAERLADEKGAPVSVDEVRAALEARPDEIAPMALGPRHMLQLAFDLTRLAQDAGPAPADVLARQKLLVILNEKTADAILQLTVNDGFYGFNPDHYLFMVQPALPGIALKNGDFQYAPDSPKRLHNHGQLVMQETMDGQIFKLDASGQRVYLSADEFAALLGQTDDKISFNIEDLDYLSGAIAGPVWPWP